MGIFLFVPFSSFPYLHCILPRAKLDLGIVKKSKLVDEVSVPYLFVLSKRNNVCNDALLYSCILSTDT